MICKNCKQDKSDVMSKNYAQSMKNQAHDQSPYGEEEPSTKTTHK